MTFRLDEATHEYWIGDRRLISVTQVLERAGMMDYRFGNDDARLRGTYVHDAAVMIDRGTLDWTILDPILAPYCRAYEKFIADAKPEILISERPMYHAQYMYAGKPDRVMTLNGFRGVFDLKSGSPHPATAVQIASYCELVRVNEDIPFLKGYSLHLRDDGTYRLDEISDLRRHFQTFLAAVTVARWKEEYL